MIDVIVYLKLIRNVEDMPQENWKKHEESQFLMTVQLVAETDADLD